MGFGGRYGSWKYVFKTLDYSLLPTPHSPHKGGVPSASSVVTGCPAVHSQGGRRTCH